MSEHIFFLIGLSLLMVHEMDAVRRCEWRMCWGLSKMSDEAGYQIFAALHFPLLIVIFGGLLAGSAAVQHWFMCGLDLFFMIHFLLHLFFLKNASNDFRSVLSWLIIGGMFFSGLFHLLFLYRMF